MPPVLLIIGGASLVAGTGLFGWKLADELGSIAKMALIGGGAFILAKHFKVI